MKNSNLLTLQSCLSKNPDHARLVFFASPPSSPAEKLVENKSAEAPRKAAKIVDHTAKFDGDLEKSLKDLAAGNESLNRNYYEALFEGLKKEGYELKNTTYEFAHEDNTSETYKMLLIDQFEQELKAKDCKKITIKDEKLLFLNDKNENVAPRAEKIPVIFKKRSVDQKAVAEKITAGLTAAKAKTARKEFLKNESGSGTVDFGKGKEAEKKYKETTIADLYPDAKIGDRVEIKRGNKGLKAEKIKNSGSRDDWAYLDKQEKPIPDKKVTIEKGDELSYAPKEVRSKTVPPEQLTNFRTLGFLEVDTDRDWEEIAKDIMKMENAPGAPGSDSPKATLEKLGYDVNNSEDVAKYADLLRRHDVDKLRVWIILPNEKNSRARESDRQEKTKKYGVENLERVLKAEDRKQAESEKVYRREYENLFENKEYKVPPKLKHLIDKGLWNEFWNGRLEGKEKIMRGFEYMGVSDEAKISKVMLGLLKGHTFGFEDLLDQLKENKIPVYLNEKGEIGSYDEFKKEFTYQSLAATVAKNMAENRWKYFGLSEDQIKYYEKNISKYGDRDKPESQRGQKFYILRDMLKGAAYIMEGVLGLQKKTDTASVEKEKEYLEATSKASTGGRLHDAANLAQISPETPQENIQAELFLQQFFHPQNSSGSLDDMPKDPEKKDDFAKKASESEAYRTIKYECSFAGRLDPKLLARELNNYILYAINLYRGNRDLATAEKLRTRYGFSGDSLNTESNNYVNSVFEQYKIPEDLKVPSGKMNYLRNLFRDGFLAKREATGGQIERPQEINWLNYGDALRSADPLTREVFKRLLIQQNPEVHFTEAELKETVQKIDQAVKESQLLAINAALDPQHDKIQVGVSKVFPLPKGFFVAAGAAINVKNGQPMVGVVIGKDIKITDQLKLTIQGGAGVEPFVPAVSGNLDAGITWLSKGSPDSAWRTKLEAGTGGGASLSFNVTDISMGPYVRFGAGRVKDGQNEFNLQMAEKMAATGFEAVEKANTIQEKALAIRSLPYGAGDALFEMQMNLFGGINAQGDQKLVNFYEGQLKEALKEATFMHARENSRGISEYGIGGTVTFDLKLVILTAALFTGGPALAAPLALGLYGRLGIVVGNEIKISRSLRGTRSESEAKADDEMIEKLSEKFPGVKSQIVEAQKFEDRDRLTSRHFVGDQLERFVETRQKAEKIDFSQFESKKAKNFEEKQREFGENHLKLSIDPETKMYVIEPTEVESYKIFADPDMQAGYGIILKNNQILVGSPESLDGLFIKRFDYFTPGEVDGAVQRTIIAISDNPLRTIGQIADSSDYYLESIYDRRRNLNNPIEHKPNRLRDESTWNNPNRQSNVQFFDQNNYYGNQELLKRFYNSETETAENLSGQEAMAAIARHIALTHLALSEPARPKELDKNIDISRYLPPAEFLKKHDAEYRKMTTEPGKDTVEKLDNLIRSEKKNAPMSGDEIILYKEKLFQLSMKEGPEKDKDATVERRLNWAEKDIYVPLFTRLLKEREALGKKTPEGITPEKLAKIFIANVRERYKKGAARNLRTGESIFTSVGVERKLNGKTVGKGIRNVLAESGQNDEHNKVIEGYDYGALLDNSDSNDSLAIEQRLIAELLLNEHSEIPKTDDAFLNSRLAKKLFTMGKDGEVPNPLINILDQDGMQSEGKFAALIKAYEAVNSGQPVPPQAKSAIASFKAICDKVREAQLGNGTPVSIDGKIARATRINGFYIAVETELKSGLYEFCLNPGSVYNEDVYMYTERQFEEAKVEGGVASGGRSANLSQKASLNITTIGITGIGKHDIAPEEKLTQEMEKPAPSGGPGNKDTVHQPSHPVAKTQDSSGASE